MNVKDLRIIAKDRKLPDDMIVMMHVRTVDVATGQHEDHTYSISMISTKKNKLAPHGEVVLLRTNDVTWDSRTVDGNIITP